MNTPFAQVVGAELAAELNQAFSRIEHCCGQLDETQMWWRSRDDMNSIANLILHLTGNVRQIIVSSVGGAPDIRERQAEFDARESLTKSQILDGLRAVIGEASAVLERQSEAAWQRIVQFQGKDISALGIAIRSVTHFRGHTQEIIHLTRTILDDRYRYVGPPPKPRS